MTSLTIATFYLPPNPSQGARVPLSSSSVSFRPRCECKTNNAVCSSNRVTKNRINLSSSSSSSSLCTCAFCAGTYLSIVFLFPLVPRFALFVEDPIFARHRCSVHDHLVRACARFFFFCIYVYFFFRRLSVKEKLVQSQ